MKENLRNKLDLVVNDGHKNEEINQMILDSLPFFTMLIRKDRTILAVNKIALEAGAEVGGTCWRDFGHCNYIPKADQDYFYKYGENPPNGTRCYFCQTEEAFEDQKSRKKDVFLGDKVFETYWIPIDGERFIHYAKDITERKKAELRLKESEVKLKGRVKELTCLYGLFKLGENPEISLEEIIQGTLHLIPIAWQFPDITCARIRFEDQEFKSYNFQETKWVLKSNIKVMGELKGSFEIFYLKEKPDMDEGPFMKEERDLIDALAENLSRIIERMELEKGYRKAYNRAEFYKDLFMHDINNVLQNILSSMELTDMYKGNLEKINHFNNIIKDQVMRGSKLVSNIRKLSKLEETEMSIKPMEICSILKKAITYVKNPYYDRNINIQVDSVSKTLYLQANELLEDVFENILGNAVKYNENPVVEINIKISREILESSDYLRMEFLDNGIGISDHRKKLVFQREVNSETRIQGMGLGLSLVKKIVETYNGKIWVEDKIKGDHSKGSNFVLLIPKV